MRDVIWRRFMTPKLLCGGGTAESQVAVYFFCGSGTMELPSIIPCAEAELQTLKSHNILCTFRKTFWRYDVMLLFFLLLFFSERSL